ncbi:MAG TPA: Lrp/AsnC family transcriptional regulator [Clostridia bacterium]|nr:Lrp/AsnC family transcriptional regulator [Clostridia bacterium]
MLDRENQILEILQEDARIAPEQIAVMIGESEETVRETIVALEQRGVLLKYMAVINQEQMGTENVRALIEVRVTPQREKGFDEIARRIVQFEEVKSLFLMSGAYDLMVMVEAPTLKQLALFVSDKLSTLENVTGTATHFMLKTYKSDGVLFESPRDDRRLAVSP